MSSIARALEPMSTARWQWGVRVVALVAAASTTGCPRPCTGAQCINEYQGSLLSIVRGAEWKDEGAVGTAWGLIEGGVTQGPDWSMALQRGAVTAGMPREDTIRTWAFEGGSLVAESSDRTIFGDISTEDLGHEVAYGDIDSDGIDDLVATSPSYDEPLGIDEGALFVFFGSDLPTAGVASVGDAAWTIVGSDTSRKFGSSMVVCGDLDGDGGADVVAASPLAPGVQGAVFAGQVWVFPSSLLSSASGKATTTTLLASGARVFTGDDANGRAGSTLWCRDDVTGDGLADLVVGAPYAPSPSGINGAGVVYVLDQSSLGLQGNLADAAVLQFSGTATDAWLGSSVTTGDFDGDGRADLAAGARSGPNGAGEVRIWASSSFGSGEVDTIIEGAEQDADFAESLLAYDPDGDGRSTLLVGIPRADPFPDDEVDSEQSGLLLSFSLGPDSSRWPATTTVDESSTRIADGRAFLRLGKSLAAADVDEDGIDDLGLLMRYAP